MTFEEAYARLTEIVRKLEEENLPLEESGALFEQGMKLYQLCSEQLQKERGKVEQLLEGARVPFEDAQ